MNLEELLEQLNFSKNAISKKTDKMPMVKALVNTPTRTEKIILNVKEIGFNDKEAIVYIEVE